MSTAPLAAPIDRPADAVPHAHEAEVALLGSMILQGAVVPDVLQTVKADSFYEQRHRTIFGAIVDLWQDTGTVDLVQLKSQLESAKMLDAVGGVPYLSEIAGSVPSSASATHYAAIVRDKALRRDLIEAAEGIAERGYEAATDAAEQLSRAEAAISAIAGAARQGADPPLRTMKLSDVVSEDVQWLWPGRFPRGKLSILAGTPGLGKSMLSLDMAARVSTGTPWPDAMEMPNPAGSVVLLACEDGLADTVRPRLDAAEADVNRVVAIQGASAPQGGVRPFDAVRDLRHLDDLMSAAADVRLVVVDPVAAFIGAKVDAHRDNEVRDALAPLAALAERHRVAVVGVMHLRKSQAASALDKVLGSVGFTALARAVWLLTRDPDDKAVRLLAAGKMNLAEPGPTLAFQIEHPGRIAWLPETDGRDADDLVNNDARRHEKPAPKREAARAWLDNLTLAAGADGITAAEVETAAGEFQHSMRTIRRCVPELGIVCTNAGIIGQPFRWFAKQYAP